MLRRLLLLGLAFFAVFWWLRQLLRSRRVQAKPAAGARPRKTGVPAPMVRDRVCNTYLAKDRALSVSVDGEEHFFCSERCRERFLAERATTA